MTGVELAYLIGSLAVVTLFLLFVRRASERSQLGDAGRTAQRRLRDAEREGEAPEEREEDETEGEYSDLVTAEDEEEPAPEEAEEDEEERLRAGLEKTRSSGFVGRIGKLFTRKNIDAGVLDQLEEVLFTADIGPATAQKLFAAVKDGLSKADLEDPEAIWSKLESESRRILAVDAPPVDYDRASPFVLLVLGVNGVGKTTTIGKLAAKLTRSGKKVLLAAGDTFRAAAVEQLEVWGERAGCPVVKGKAQGDPSSVIFDAIKRGQDEGYDVVIADTAGRLHTKVDLMEELKKVGRVIDKAQPGAPHETWLVLDSTTGQNAIQQAQMFKEAMAISGIVLTKLDGTAKGGVILGISDELEVPVRYIGIGEQIDDMRAFDPEAFVAALYERGVTVDAA